METSGYKKFLELQHKGYDINGFMSVESVPFSIHHKIGVSQEGFPLFFVKCDRTLTSVDINLELITVLFSQDCCIKENDIDSKDIYTIVLLKTLNRDLQQYFTDVFSIILQQISIIPSERELYKEIMKVIELFSSISKPPKKSIQGLWSELLVIDSSKDPEYLISAWHISPADKYDFNDGKDKLEVKSTSKQNRIHKFSIEQLEPNAGSQLLVASVFVIETGIGKSILDLRDHIISRVSDINIKFKLNQIIYRTIGVDYEKLSDVFFDYQLAIDSLSFYYSEDIPKIDKSKVPSEISNIVFDCDLSNASTIRINEDLLRNSNLFLSLCINE